MKTLALIFLALLFSAAVPRTGAAPSAVAGPAPTVRFTIGKAFWDVSGRIEPVSYSVNFDPQNPGEAKIKGSVNVKDIDTGNKTRDKQLQDEDWFDAKNHPKIRIESADIRALGGGRYEGAFFIEMKGKRLKRDLTFRVAGEGAARRLEAEFTLDREDWGVGGGTFAAVVGEEVEVHIILPF